VYLIEWYDIEAESGWGSGAKQPPLVHQVGYIISWPRKNQKVPSYRVASAFVENEPGGVSIIPAAVVEGEPTEILEHKIHYRTMKELGRD
jgi:hypothetical protein